MHQTLPRSPKSSAQYAESFAALHKLIASFVTTNKDRVGRGFAYNEFPSAILNFATLDELQKEGPDLIGMNNDLYDQLIDLLQTYDIDREYVSVVRVIRNDVTRFIVQTGSLDENAWEEIISEEEIRQRDALQLRAKAAERIAELKADRAPRKKKNKRK